MPTTINATPVATRPKAAKRLASRPPIFTKVSTRSALAPAKSKPLKLKPGQLDGGKKSLLRLPATGGYIGGNKTGAAMALMLLKHMRGDKREMGFLTMQQRITEFMECMEREGCIQIARPSTEWTSAEDSRRGQYIGFFNTLGHWMAAAAKQLGGDLDSLTEEMLLEQACSGLNFDQESFLRDSDDAS